MTHSGLTSGICVFQPSVDFSATNLAEFALQHGARFNLSALKEMGVDTTDLGTFDLGPHAVKAPTLLADHAPDGSFGSHMFMAPIAIGAAGVIMGVAAVIHNRRKSCDSGPVSKYGLLA